MAHNPVTVANYFLSEYGKLYEPNLQEWLYFAHGWYLVFEEKPFINEEPEAAEFGPIFPTLHSARKMLTSDSDIIPHNESPSEALPERDKRFLQGIYEKYSPLNMLQIIVLTHADGSPWHQVAKEHLEMDAFPCGLLIPNDVIKAYFTNIWEEQQKDKQ